MARNRRRRSDQFLQAALAIVVEDGFDALTMARLARDLETAIGSVYRYYPSKAHLISAIQSRAIDRLSESYDAAVPEVVAAVASQLDDDDPLIPAVVLGRWFCRVSEVYTEEVRLLQMLSARRSSPLPSGGGEELVPTVMGFLERVLSAIETASDAGAIDDGNGLARAIMWVTAIGGVLEADDYAGYLPEILGETRLARQLTLDLLVGWGAETDAVLRVDQALDLVLVSLPLIPGGQPPAAPASKGTKASKRSKGSRRAGSVGARVAAADSKVLADISAAELALAADAVVAAEVVAVEARGGRRAP